MDLERQSVYEAINRSVQSRATHADPHDDSDDTLQYGDEHTSETKGEKELAVPIISSSNSNQENFTNLIQAVSSPSTIGIYTSSALYQQVLTVNPLVGSCYHGGQESPAAYSGHACHLPPGLPQLPQTPGFLTGAGYHLAPAETSLLGSQRFAMSSLLPPGQAGTALHFAAIIGDKRKLAATLQDKNVNLEARDRWGRVALVFAVLGNHQECVELLLRAGAKPDAVDSHRRTPLHFSAYKGHLGCIKAILHAVESKNTSHSEHCNGVWLAQDVRGVTPLHHAAIHNNHKCLQALLKYAVPGTLDTEDHKKRTPLHWAAAYGSQENVRLLIKHGSNNLMPDQEGKTPLHWAAMSEVEGAKECVRTLIAAAPSSVNWQDFDGITALHLAVAEARKDIVEVILSVPNCNVALTDNQFRTALHWACSRGLSAIAAVLMKRVSQVDAVDIYGATPLHYAAQHNHADCVKLLVRRQRVRDISSLDGHTSLMWAAAQGADSALTAIVHHGTSLTQADPRGCTALHIAAGAGHSSTVRLLLCLQAPPDVCANDGRTPVHFAARAGHTQIVKELAKAGASLQRRDEEGQCALHHAVLGGHLFLAQILIRAGTSVNVQDYYGRTPLHMAAYRGLSDIMFLLLENRGDVNARDFEGMSALHWAAEQGHLGAVNTLLDFHAYPNYTQSTPNRYTPYDCACVAEQLEVAQVLAEAGGISVTKIMEVAATRIQAAVRGHFTRSKLKRQCGLQGNQEGKTFIDEKSKVLSKPLTDCSTEVSSNKPLCSQLIFERNHTSKQTENSTSSSAIAAIDASQASGNREEREPASKLSLTVRMATSASDYGPYNSVSGQRRSKALPASIMRGAGKKTLRNLELPGLGELGVKQFRHLRSPEYSEESDSETDTTEWPKPLVTENLQLSSNIVATSLTAGEESYHTHEEDKSKIICEKQSYSCLSLITNIETEGQQEKNSESVSDVDKTIKDYCKKDGSEEEDSSLHNSCWSNIHLISSPRSQVMQDNIYQEKFEDDNRSSGTGIKGNRDNSKANEIKQILEENSYTSQLINDVMIGSRSTGRLAVERKMLNKEAVKQAERKWKSKLATVTLQRVQGPDGSKSVTLPYSLVKPHIQLPQPSSSKAYGTSNTNTTSNKEAIEE